MNTPIRTLVNGAARADISVSDRGLQYGDGVFRTLRVEQGVPRHWGRHVARLLEDAQRIALAPVGAKMLETQAGTLCSGISTAVMKIILTRGVGVRGYQPSVTDPTILMLLYPMPEHSQENHQTGIRMHLCETRLSQNPRLAGIKHLNRLEQVLARAEWSDPSITEGLMRDMDDRIIEGVSSNLFLVKDGVLMTPDLGRCGVTGVTREMILESATAYTKSVQIRDLTLEDLYSAEECMVCNSVIGVRPVVQLGDHQWPVGPVTSILQRHIGTS